MDFLGRLKLRKGGMTYWGIDGKERQKMVVLKCFCRELKTRFKLSKGFSETTKVILRVRSPKGIKKKVLKSQSSDGPR